MLEWIAVVAASLSVVGTIGAAIVTGRANRRTVQTEKTLPPYEALAKRVGDLECRVHKEWQRANTLEGKLDTLEDELVADRDWIKRVIAVAVRRDAIDHIQPLPHWYDPHSDSARQRRNPEGGHRP